MATIGSLFVNLDTNIASFQRDMGKASTAVKSGSARMNRSLATVQKSWLKVNRTVMRSIKSHLNFQSAIATLAGSAGMGYLIKQSIEYADAIGKTADRLGVGTDALQAYRFAAEQSGVEQRLLDDGLQRFNRRIGLAIDGNKSYADTFKKLGVNVEAVKNGQLSIEDAFLQTADAVQKIGTVSEKAATISLAFGEDAGPKLVNLLDQGRDGILRYTQQASQLGFILEEDIIRNSEQAGDNLNILGKIIKVNFTAGLLDGFLGDFNEFAELAKDPELADAVRNIGELLAKMALLTGSIAKGINSFSDGFVGMSRQTGNFLGNQIRRRQGRGPVSLDQVDSRRQAVANVRAFESDLRGMMNDLDKAENFFKTTTEVQTETTAAVQNQSEVMDYAAEAAANVAAYQKEYNDALASTGDMVSESTRAIEAQTFAWDDLGKNASTALADIIMRGGEARDVLYQLVKSMSSTLFENTAGNAISSLAGSFVSGLPIGPGGLKLGAMNMAAGGGLFAEGGVTNRPAIFGEAGPEAAVPLSRGREIPVELKGSGKNGSDTYYIDARGADKEGLARLEAMIRQVNGTVERRAVAAVSDRFRRTSDYLRR
jgi:hypothetical protein